MDRLKRIKRAKEKEEEKRFWSMRGKKREEKRGDEEIRYLNIHSTHQIQRGHHML